MSPAKQAIEIEGVRLTSPDKVLYAGQGITKRDLAEYYQRVADWLLPHLAGRPLTLIRCPSGQGKECFVQRRATGSFPSSIRRVEVEVEGEGAEHLVADSLEAVLALVQFGTLELHTWGARRDRLDRPDRLIFDLDPAPGLPFRRVGEAAREVRARLEELGLESFVKTTGGKGLHVVVPLVRRSSWDEARAFSRAVAEEMERMAPERYVAEASKEEREGKIFVDYLRNAWAATAVTPYSTRARQGAPVSAPVRWDELDGSLDPADFTVETVPDRLKKLKKDPWDGYDRVRQWITRDAREAVGLS